MKITFHYTYLLIAISFIITGYFSNLIIFTSIIIIHEIGHYLLAKITKLNPTEIIIYPFGGITKTSHIINTKINKELVVAISGIVFQTIYYLFITILYKHNIVREYIYNIFTTYYYHLLFFNLLPIYPLDGMIILNLLISKLLPYKLTMKLNIYISIITSLIILITNYYKFNYTTILIISVIVTNIIKYHKNIDYLFNRFLLERYLYKIPLKGNKIITKINTMYKEKYHIFMHNNHYLTEKQVLKRRFNRKL